MAAIPDLASPQGRLAEIFRSGKHSDLTLSCADGKTFQVHKVILDVASQYFSKLFRFEWKETANSLCELDKSHGSKVIQAMLDFIYTGSYAKGAEKDGRPELLQLHMDALVVADYYQVPKLGEYARLRFLDAAEDKANWGNVKTAWPAIVETLYNDFPAPANKCLKRDILRVTWNNIHAFEGDAEFQQLLENVGAFAADLFHLSRSESKRADLFRSTCTDCDKVLHNAGGAYSSQCGPCKLRAKAQKRRRVS